MILLFYSHEHRFRVDPKHSSRVKLVPSPQIHRSISIPFHLSLGAPTLALNSSTHHLNAPPQLLHLLFPTLKQCWIRLCPSRHLIDIILYLYEKAPSFLFGENCWFSAMIHLLQWEVPIYIGAVGPEFHESHAKSPLNSWKLQHLKAELRGLRPPVQLTL